METGVKIKVVARSACADAAQSLLRVGAAYLTRQGVGEDMMDCDRRGNPCLNPVDGTYFVNAVVPRNSVDGLHRFLTLMALGDQDLPSAEIHVPASKGRVDVLRV